MAEVTAQPPESARAILEAARRRFIRFGARKTTMTEVAREAGCSRATVYTHFPTKEALYAGLLAWDTDAFLAEVERAMADLPDARRKLRRIVERTRATYAQNPVLRLALEQDAEMTLAHVAAAFTHEQERRITSMLRRVLEDGVAEGSLRPVDPERVAYLMYQLGHVLVTREAAGRADYPFAEIMGVMDDVFNYGIAAPAGRGDPTSGEGA